MTEIRCKKCGIALEKNGEQYVCPGCGARYEERRAEVDAAALAKLLDGQKQERVANLRQQLWREFGREYYDRAEIGRLAREIRGYLPDDFFATFCELACGKNVRLLNDFLYRADVSGQAMYVWDMLAFLTRPLREETLLAVNDLLARAGSAGLDMGKFLHYNALLSAEAEKLTGGVYDADLPRDVFVAYSSADMAEVGRLVEVLEGQKLRCFVAARNLQHGAIQNYEESLRRAMDRCKTFLFVSSKNSRSRTCDALRVELPYIRERDILAAPKYRNDYEKMPAAYKKPRVEYLLDAHTGSAADAIVEEFFAGYEYCYADADEAARRILRYIASGAAPAVRYCLACGAENPASAKFCSACGGSEFADSREECDEAMRRAKEGERLAAERRKAEQEKQKAEREAAALKEELRRLRMEASGRAAGAAAPAQSAPASPAGTAPAQAAPASSARPTAQSFELSRGVLVKYTGKDVELELPEGIKKIGNGAFEGCASLRRVTLPAGVTEIGKCAFKNCKGLRQVALPQGLARIGGQAFMGCEHLGEDPGFTLPESTEEIGDEAFFGCTRLGGFLGSHGSIRIPKGLKKVGCRAFSDCSSLGRLALPEGVSSIGGGAFSGCKNLSSVVLPGRVAEIDTQSLFSGCASLTEVSVPAGAARIGTCAFRNCHKLRKVTIPDSVTEVADTAFSGCKELEELYLPNPAAKIGRGAFDDMCFKISRVIRGDEFALYLRGGNVVIRDDIRSVGASAFSGSRVISVELPEGVEAIGDGAFAQCPALTRVKLPQSLKRIGNNAFDGCAELWNLAIPEGVISIGDNAFRKCALERAAIPAGVEAIGAGSFAHCGRLKEVAFARGCALRSIGAEAFAWTKLSLTLELPQGLAVIGARAFESCRDLHIVKIPDGVQSIGEGAFSCCSFLSQVKLPERMELIGKGAFDSCSLLEKVAVGAREIADRAFSGCAKLKSVAFLPGVQQIGERAFAGCKALTSVDLPDTVTEIGQFAFAECAALKDITIPAGLHTLRTNSFSSETREGLKGLFHRTKLRCRGAKPANWPAGWDLFFKGKISWIQ